MKSPIKLFISFFFLFACDVIHPIFDEFPWFVINNSTALPWTCQIEAIHYVDKVGDFVIDKNANQDFSLQWIHEHDEQGKLLVKFLIFFDCMAYDKLVFDPLFYCNDRENVIIPTITSVGFIQNDLQLLTFYEPVDSYDRFISIAYDSDQGMVTSSCPIPLYIKIASKAQLAYTSLLASIAKLTN